MDKVFIVFWTMTGNTGAMANGIAEGVKAAGKEPVLLSPSEANIEDLKGLPAFAMGCPAMGAEVLEEAEMEPFVAEVEGIVKGKQVALFGSYGWGDGEWMRDWEARMQSAGATLINGEGLMAHETPDEDALEECKALGKTLAGI